MGKQRRQFAVVGVRLIKQWGIDYVFEESDVRRFLYRFEKLLVLIEDISKKKYIDVKKHILIQFFTTTKFKIKEFVYFDTWYF